MTCPEILEAIANLAEGLIYISETDSPIYAFQAARTVDTLTPASFLRAAGKPPLTPIEARDFNEFFERLVRQDAAWRDLKTFLENNLREMKVYKVGHIQLEIFIVGLFTDNEIIGVKMLAVET